MYKNIINILDNQFIPGKTEQYLEIDPFLSIILIALVIFILLILRITLKYKLEEQKMKDKEIEYNKLKEQNEILKEINKNLQK